MFLPAPDEAIWVGVLRIVLEVPHSRSLKEKRRAVARVRDRLRPRHHLSVAEVGHLDDQARSVLAISTISNDSRAIQSSLDKVLHDIQSWSEARIVEVDVDLLRPHGEWQD